MDRLKNYDKDTEAALRVLRRTAESTDTGNLLNHEVYQAIKHLNTRLTRQGPMLGYLRTLSLVGHPLERGKQLHEYLAEIEQHLT